jgi:hypothetical protein
MTKKEAGKIGGMITASRYGSNYMSFIGYSGYLVNLETNFYDDPELYALWLRYIAKGKKKTLESSDYCDSRR